MKKISLLFLSLLSLVLMSASAAADTISIDFESFNEYDSVSSISTTYGNVNFYMTSTNPLIGLSVGQTAALTPTGDLPEVGAEDTKTSPGDNIKIVGFTVNDQRFGGTDTTRDDYVRDPAGTGAGGKTLTDTRDMSRSDLLKHAYTKYQSVVIDLSSLSGVQSFSMAAIDLDHTETWNILYFDSSNVLINKQTMGPGIGYAGDGKAYLISYANPNIAKVVFVGSMNLGEYDRLGFALDNLEIEVEEQGCEDYTTDLIAGGGNPKSAMDAGQVTVSSDGESLEVTYQTEDGWEITETHLDIECSLDEIPQKNGNPIPGKFEYSNDFEPGVTEHTVTINLDDLCCTDPIIAAHAVVQKKILLNPTPYYADVVVDYNQSLRKDGTPVRPGRSVPEQGLAFETGRDETNFFSLGFGGWLIAGFNCPIRNGPGDDIKVIEDTWGSYPLEKAEVYASNDGVNWVYLGLADNTVRDPVYNIHTIATFDLGSMTEAKYIKVIDVSDPAVHNNEADGYDLNAIESLQDCVEIQEETAWGEGPGFPGKNWAMYFSYDLSDCYEPQCLESGSITGAAVSSPNETTWLGLISVLSIAALAVVSIVSMKKK